MTSRLDLRRRAAGIAQAMGAPVEPCVYMASLTASGGSRAEIRLPIERGPFVAFDGYFYDGESVNVSFDDQILMWTGSRPIIWQHLYRDPFYGALNIGAPGCVVWPQAGKATPGAGNLYNLDGWPAPVFVQSGEVFAVERQANGHELTLALPGFHTSLPAWREIHSSLGEVRFLSVGSTVSNTRGQDELPAREPVELRYAYNVQGYTDPTILLPKEVRRLDIENRILAQSKREGSVGAPFLGVPLTSSPASVIGPRPLPLNGTTSLRWDMDSGESDIYPLNVFVGVARVDI